MVVAMIPDSQFGRKWFWWRWGCMGDFIKEEYAFGDGLVVE